MEIFGPELKKKGALEISINAIVILILAITILGLGLGFIKKQFGALGSQFTEVSEEIKSEIVGKIKASGELLVFNKFEITATVGKPETFYAGIKNTANDPSCFWNVIKCIKGLANSCESGQPGATIVVGGGMPGMETADGNKWFSIFSTVDIKGGDVAVFPITLQLPGRVIQDTYLMQYDVFKADEPGECATANPPANINQPYQSKQFYVIVR